MSDSIFWEQISHSLGKKIEFNEDGEITTDLTEEEQNYIGMAMSIGYYEHRRNE